MAEFGTYTVVTPPEVWESVVEITPAMMEVIELTMPEQFAAAQFKLAASEVTAEALVAGYLIRVGLQALLNGPSEAP